MNAISASATNPVAIYLRLSQSRSHDGEPLGIDRQRAACLDLAARRKLTVGGEYIDVDKSAFKRKVVRPAYQKMMSDLAAGIIGGVVVYDADRFTRQDQQTLDLLNIADATGAQLYTATGEFDLSTSMGRFMLKTMTNHAVLSSEDTSRRVKDKQAQLALAGGYHGGRRPYGFERDGVTHVPAETAIIRELADRIITGETAGALCRDLNRRGALPSAGARWRITSLRRLMVNKRLAGIRVYHGQDVATATWAPILDPDTARAVRRALATRQPRGGVTPRRYLLTGLLSCGECGETLRGNPHKGHPRYVCISHDEIGCGKISIRTDPLETFVRIEASVRLIALSGSGTTGGDGNAAEVDAITRAERMELDAVIDAHNAKQITMSEYLRLRDPIVQRIADAERSIQHVSPELQSLRDLADAGDDAVGIVSGAAWEQLPVLRQHDILRLVIKSITINRGTTPGRREFDQGRVVIQYR